MTSLPPDPLGRVSPETYAVVRVLVDSAPPLTAAQISALKVLFARPRQEWPRDTERAVSA